MTKPKQPNPAVGSLWIRKRDTQVFRVDTVNKTTVSVCLMSLLIVYDTPRATFFKNFKSAENAT